MVQRQLDALKDYFVDADDAAGDSLWVGPPGRPQSLNRERLLRILVRVVREEAQLIQDLRQRVAALEARVR